ncbi:phosphoadenosine phosphosulfate reductase domain-containing protein [Paenibacillus sp. FSL L8-0709]|uniref:phosphoadenosine phosphosulfate reductase domain-containing protein n=1 Tax=Paenibacillus sp. FSL L8-0709 TaxID=2975312 RepID=UPI0030FAC86A
MNKQMELFPSLDANHEPNLEGQDEGSYKFSMTEHRISIAGNIKKQTNVTTALWIELRNLGFAFLGVVRDHSAVFEVPFAYLTVHHFVQEQPAIDLVAAEGVLKWHELLDPQNTLGRVINYLETNGFHCHVPVQAWTDAWSNEVDYILQRNYRDWHLESPKHKLMVWCKREDHSYLLEFFINMLIPPYGLSEPMDYPSLAMKTDSKRIKGQRKGNVIKEKETEQQRKRSGEDFEIMENVAMDKLEYASAAIHEIMSNNRRIIVTFSGGKDSYVCLLLVINYLLEHPNCKTEVTILSASTGVENPVIESHIQKVKEAVESLSLDIPFIIVRPDIENTYMVCVLAKGYSPPTNFNRWCVSRLKLNPADQVLADYMDSPEFFTFFGQEEVCLILGTRDAESTNRAKSVQKYFGNDFYGSHRIEGIRTSAPIRFWDAKDVVTFLVRNPAPWKDYGNYNLINLYGSAMGGFEECPIGAMISSESEAISSCTGSGAPRMGCFSCTVIKDDQSLINMAKDYEFLEDYLSMRQILKKTQDIRYGTNTGYQRKYGIGQFGSGLGDLTLDIRTLLLEHMFKLNIPLLEEEIYTIYRIVREREISEGIAITKRFRNALFNMRRMDYSREEDEVVSIAQQFDVVGSMYSSIWDPWNSGVDKFGQADLDAIKRVMEKRSSVKS